MAGIGLAFAGCGQKGALYLPGDPSEIQTEIPARPGQPSPEPDGPGDDGEAGAVHDDDDDR